MHAIADEAAVELVLGVARRVARRLWNTDAEDLVAWGWLGLETARRAFDGRGTFEGFARMKVRAAILDGLRSFNHTRSGRGVRVQFLEQDELDRVAGAAELAASDARLDLPVLLAELPLRTERLLRRRFFRHETLAVSGSALGVSETRACQIERDALEELRRRFGP